MPPPAVLHPNTVSSASGRVFACPELLAEVFGYFLAPSCLELGDDPPRCADRATLNSCARACRTFSDVALDVLWATLDDLFPLLKLFSCFTKTTNFYIFTEDIDAEWARFQRYARRVRIMHYGAHSRHNTIHSSVWVHLARRCGGQGLLPRIRRLEAYNLSLSDVGPVTLLLSSTIRKLIVNFLGFGPEDGKDLDPDLPLIAAALFHDIVKTTAPHLTDLSLWDSFPLSPSHSALLGQCHNLRHLSVEGEAIKFNADAIRALERLDSLKFAHMVIRLDDCQTAVDLRLQTGFPALKSLILDGSAPDVANFIIAARLVALKSVDVTLVDSTDMSAVKGCLTQIAAHLPRRLRSFRFTVTSISPGSPAATLRELLDPLYSLKGMRSVDLDLGDHNYGISDDDLKDLACAWPVLDRFEISSTVGSCVPRRKPLRCPTIRGLVELAQHCPRLTAISLPALDTKMLPAPESVPVLGRSRMDRLSLRRISASGSNMHFNLAVLLDRLFPTLENLDIGTSGGEGVAREVFRYLEVMQQGREHSQLFWQDCATDDDLEDEDSEEDSEDEDSEVDLKMEENDHSEEGEED